MSGFPVDLVYTWVDGSDPVWRRRRRPFYRFQNARLRWNDQGELAVSVETARRFAPWVRNIFIVHDDCQRPRVSGPGIHHVPHRTILPEKILPTFSSVTIESFLHRIPGLSEQFLYSNDDSYFVQPCRVEDFFAEERNIVYVCRKESKAVDSVDGRFRYSARDLGRAFRQSLYKREKGDSLFLGFLRALEQKLWRIGLYNAEALLHSINRQPRVPPLHQIRGLRKSVCLLAWEQFSVELEESTNEKFRSVRSIAFANYLVPWLGVLKGSSELVELPEGKITFLECEYNKGSLAMLNRLAEYE